MAIRRANFGQVDLSTTFADGGDQNNRKQQYLGDPETVEDGEICIKADLSNIDNGSSAGGIVTALIQDWDAGNAGTTGVQSGDLRSAGNAVIEIPWGTAFLTFECQVAGKLLASGNGVELQFDTGGTIGNTAWAAGSGSNGRLTLEYAANSTSAGDIVTYFSSGGGSGLGFAVSIDDAGKNAQTQGASTNTEFTNGYNGIVAGKFYGSVGATNDANKLVNAHFGDNAVDEAELKDIGGGYTGIPNAKFGGGITNVKFDNSAVTAADLKDVDVTTYGKAKITLNQGGGSAIAGSFFVTMEHASLRGAEGSYATIAFSTTTATGWNGNSKTLTIRVNESSDTVTNIISAIQGINEGGVTFAASNSGDPAVNNPGTVIAAIGNISVSQHAGRDFANYSGGVNTPVPLYRGIELSKFDNLSIGTNELINAEISPDHIQSEVAPSKKITWGASGGELEITMRKAGKMGANGNAVAIDFSNNNSAITNTNYNASGSGTLYVHYVANTTTLNDIRNHIENNVADFTCATIPVARQSDTQGAIANTTFAGGINGPVTVNQFADLGAGDRDKLYRGNGNSGSPALVKGLVESDNLSAKTDATTNSMVGLSDAQKHDYANITKIGTYAGSTNLDMQSSNSTKYKVVNAGVLSAITGSADCATKEYVDAYGPGASWKDPVKFASRKAYTAADGFSVSGGGVMVLASNGKEGAAAVFLDEDPTSNQSLSQFEVDSNDRILLWKQTGNAADGQQHHGIWECTQRGQNVSQRFGFSANGNKSTAAAEMENMTIVVDIGATSKTFVFKATGNTGDLVGGSGADQNYVKVVLSGVAGQGNLQAAAEEIRNQFRSALEHSNGHGDAVRLAPEGSSQNNRAELDIQIKNYHTVTAGMGATTFAKNSASGNTQNYIFEKNSATGYNNAGTLAWSAGQEAQFKRPDESDRIEELSGAAVFVTGGDYYKDVAFFCETDTVTSFGSTGAANAIVWRVKTSLGAYTGGAGISFVDNAWTPSVGSGGVRSASIDYKIVRKRIRARYNGSNAVLMEFSEGNVDSVTRTNNGSGYTNGTHNGVAVTATSGNGSGATFNVTIGGGSVTGISVVKKGEFYAPGDTITLDPAVIGAGNSDMAMTLNAANLSGTLDWDDFGHNDAGNGYDGANNPLEVDHKHQLFLNGILLNTYSQIGDGHAGSKLENTTNSATAESTIKSNINNGTYDYKFVELDSGRSFNQASGVQPGGGAWGDGFDEARIKTPAAANNSGPSNAVGLYMDGEALSPGDILELRVYKRR